MRVVKRSVQEDREIQAFERANREYVERNLRYVRIGIMWPLMFLVVGIALAFVLYVGGTKVANGDVPASCRVQCLSRHADLADDVARLGDQHVPAGCGVDEPQSWSLTTSRAVDC